MRRTKSVVLAAVMAVALLPTVAAASTTMTATIDFEGLAEGAIVSAVSDGSGISGDPIGGVVGIQGTYPGVGENRAMIFDSTCDPTWTGGDDDLCDASLGNTLIVSEDGDSSDPDDGDLPGMTIVADFSSYGPLGTVDVASVTLIDVERYAEAGGTVEAFAPDGTSLGSVAIVGAGNGVTQTVAVGATGVEMLVVTLAGSAAIDNVELSVTEPDDPPGGGGDEGCTPGYWKQPQHLDSWEATGYSPDQLFRDVFGDDSFGDITLLEALKLRGNRNGEALVRHAVAGLLNASSSDVDYFWTVDDVFDAYMYGLKDALEEANEAGCPLN